VPAGFVGAGGIGAAGVVGIVGAGAAAATTAVVVAGNHDETTTTTVAAGVSPTSTTTTTLAPVTTTTTLPATNHAPFAVLSVSPDPPSGQGPLTVTFDLCKSTDPDKDGLSFFFDFGDGAKTSGSCLESHTYSATLRGAGNFRAQDKSYAAEACVVDPGNLSACRRRNVGVTSPPPPTTTPACPAPTITITSAPSEAETCFPPEPVTVTAETSMDTTAVQFCASAIDPSECPSAEFRSANVRAGALPACASASGSEGEFTGTVDLDDFGCYQIVGTATNGCGRTATSPRAIVELTVSCFRNQTSKGSAVAWSSDLSLEGGRLQVVVNGILASYPERGRSLATARIRDGENRVEAAVVGGAGKAGRWTMDLSLSEAIQAGSIRVLAGEIESIGGAAVTFKLKGTPGERVVFTFLKK
jgi:hypothetical protein